MAKKVRASWSTNFGSSSTGSAVASKERDSQFKSRSELLKDV
jgi:hypothetical protein